MRSLSFLLLTCTLPFIAFSQCENSRYLSNTFSSQRISSNDVYGNAPALAGFCTLEFWTSNEQLKVDFYEPVGDTASKRPCLVFAHGGAFAIGDKRFIPVEDFCYEMAKRGYVVASIDYRKCFNALSYSSSVRAVYRAVQDMNAAIRYIKEVADTYQIDTNYVFAGGNSSGSFMAMHAAYADEDERAALLPETYDFPNLGCLDCSGNSFNHSSKPAAVVNLWGALFDTTWIEPNDPPLISFHGGLDLIVYPGYWPPFSWLFFPSVYGSLPITERMANTANTYELHYFPLQGHEPWLLSGLVAPYYFDYIADNTSRFLYENLLKPEPVSISGAIPGCTSSSNSYQINDSNPASTYCWQISGGNILSQNFNGSEITVQWFAPGTGELSVTETNELDAAGSPNNTTISIHNECCPTPYFLNETVTSPTSADLSWTGSVFATAYEIEGGRTGGSTRTISQTVTSRSINILQPSTSYSWRVRAQCGSDYSEYSETQTFATPSSKLQHNENTDAITLTPNPAIDEVLVSLSLPLWVKDGTLQITDLHGRILYAQKANYSTNYFKLNLKSLQLSSGIYYVSFINPDTKLQQQLFVH